MNTEAKTAPEVPVTQRGKSAASAKKKAIGAGPKAGRPAQAAKDSPRLSRSASSTEKLACRYCGSDDLAPSFKKRRDGRCRACFKKRYRSAAPGKQTARTRKKKAAK